MHYIQDVKCEVYTLFWVLFEWSMESVQVGLYSNVRVHSATQNTCGSILD